MQRTLSLNSREYELVRGSVKKAQLSIKCLPWPTDEDRRAIMEEFDKLLAKIEDIENNGSGGVFIDGERV